MLESLRRTRTIDFDIESLWKFCPNCQSIKVYSVTQTIDSYMKETRFKYGCETICLLFERIGIVDIPIISIHPSWECDAFSDLPREGFQRERMN